MDKNGYASTNKAWWEKMVKEGNGYTKPWLDLDIKVLRKFAKGNLKNPPKPLNRIYPVSILSDINGKDVLCLASGGGQQSAVFSLLGANVTVMDIAEGQLNGDKKAAEHYGYTVKTIQGNMMDLSMLKPKSFDLAYQAPSISYIPDVKKMYLGVARVLRNNGLYCADASNPLAFQYEYKGNKGYYISMPYSVKMQRWPGNTKVIEYRHYLSEVFNGLIDSGFTIEHVEEMPERVYKSKGAKPGSWEHSLKYVPSKFCILARKTKNPKKP